MLSTNPIEGLLGFFLVLVILGGCVGIPFLMVVALVTPMALLVARRFGNSPTLTFLDALVVCVPITTYVGLTWLVEDRQTLNWYLANLMVAIPVCAGAIVRPWIPQRWQLAWAIPVVVIGMGVAFWAWRVVPIEPLRMRMF